MISTGTLAAVADQAGEKSDGAGSVWDYVSASRLNLWLKCPLAFKLRYLEGIRFPTPPAVFLGKQVHATLEWHYRHMQLGLPVANEDVCWILATGWEPAAAEEGVSFESAQESAQLQSKGIDLVRAYLAKVADETARPLAVETTIEMPLVDPRNGEDLGIPLLGVMDLVLQEDTGSLIVDFKTAARAEQLSELTHEIQLGCYAYLFRQAAGHVEQALEIRRLVKTKVPQITFYRWPSRTDSQFGRLFAVVRAYLDDLHASRFVYRPGHACSWCDFRQRHCARWAG